MILIDKDNILLIVLFLLFIEKIRTFAQRSSGIEVGIYNEPSPNSLYTLRVESMLLRANSPHLFNCKHGPIIWGVLFTYLDPKHVEGFFSAYLVFL